MLGLEEALEDAGVFGGGGESRLEIAVEVGHLDPRQDAVVTLELRLHGACGMNVVVVAEPELERRAFAEEQGPRW